MKKKQVQNKLLNYAMAFCIPIVIMLIVFFSKNVFPFGDSTTIYDDLNNQYLSFFAYLKSHWNNIHDLFYTYSLTTGGNFFGIVTYYLMSPLNVIVLFFSVSKLPIAIIIIQLIKLGLLGCSMYLLLEYRTKNIMDDENETVDISSINFFNVCLSVSFALMGYSISYQSNLMWTDTIIMLPIVILGLEKIVNKERPYLFICALFYAILLNYYIGFMVCIFVAIYYAYRLIITKYRDGVSLKKNLLKSLPVLIVSSFIGVGLSVITLWPGLKAVQSVKSNPYHFKLSGLFQPMDFLKQMYSGTTSGSVSADGYPFIYTGILVLVLCVYYFLSKNIKIQEKITTTGLIIILVLTQTMQGTYQIWHGFNQPNGFNNRNAFVFSFIFIIIASDTVLKNSLKLNLNKSFSIILLYIFVTFLAGKLYPDFITVPVIAFNIILFVGIITSLYFFNDFKKTSKAILLLLLIFDFGLNTYKHTNFGEVSINAFSKYTKEIRSVLKSLPDNKKSFYRVGMSFERSDNDPLLLDYYGLSSYSSAENPNTVNLMQKFGYYQNHDWTRWTNFNNGSTFGVDSLFGVKYIVDSNGKLTDSQMNSGQAGSALGGNNFGYNGVTASSSELVDGFKIYENKYALGLVSIVNSTAISDNKIIRETQNDPFVFINHIFNQISSSKKTVYSAANLIIKNTENSNKREYTINTNRNGPLYAYLPTKLKDMSMTNSIVKVNGAKVSKAYNQQENGIIYLGSFKSDQAVNLTIETTSDLNNSEKDLKPIVYTEDLNLVKNILTNIKDNKLNNLSVSSSKISFTVNKKQNLKNKVVMLTIPYDQGWSAYQNGTKIKTYKAMDGMMAIKISNDDTSKIEIRYFPAGLKLGILVSIVSLLIFIIFIWYYERAQSKKNNN